MRHALLNVQRSERRKRITNHSERLRFSARVHIGPHVDIGVGVGATGSVGPLEPSGVNERLTFQSCAHQVDKKLTGHGLPHSVIFSQHLRAKRRRLGKSGFRYAIVSCL